MKYREANSWGEFYWWHRRGKVIQCQCDLCGEKIAHPHFGTAHTLMEAHLIREHKETHNSSLLTPALQAGMVKQPKGAKTNDVPF